METGKKMGLKAAVANGKEHFVMVATVSGTNFPEYMSSTSLAKSGCTHDPIYGGPADVYKSRHGILAKIRFNKETG